MIDVTVKTTIVSLFFILIFSFQNNDLYAYPDFEKEFNRVDKDLIPTSLDEALSATLKLNKLIAEEDDSNQQARVWFLLGKIYFFQYKYILSNFYYQRAIDLAENDVVKDSDLLKKLYNNIGVCQELIENYDKALDFYYKSLILETNIGDSTGIYMSKINIGLAYFRLDMLDSAENVTLQAHRFFEKKNDQQNYFLAHQNLGIIYKELGEYQKALIHLNEAFQYYRDNQDYRGAGLQLGDMIDASLKLNNLSNATHFLNMLNDYKSLTENPYLDALYHEYLGAWHEYQWNYNKAIEFYQIALVKYGDLSLFLKESKLLEKLTILHFNLRNEHGFVDALSKFSSKINQKIKFNIGNSIAENSAIYQSVLEEKEITFNNLKLRNTLQTYKLILFYLLTLLLFAGGAYVVWKNNAMKSAKLKESEKMIEVLSEKIVHLEEDKLKGLYEEILKIIKDNFNNPELNLDMITKLVGSNQTYVSRAININSGMGLPKLINQERVAFAQKLIHEGKDLNDVYVMAGFSSKSSFFRYFKEYVGSSPKAYLDSIGKLLS